MSKVRVKPVSLTLPFEVISALDVFSKAAGISRSACASELLTEAVPTLLAAAQSIEEMKRLTKEQREMLEIEFSLLEQQTMQINQENIGNSAAILSLIHQAKFSKL